MDGLDVDYSMIDGLVGESTFELPCVIQARLRRGHRVDVGAFTGIYGGLIGNCQIGRFCSIAPSVIISQDEHPTTWLSTSMFQYVNNVHGWQDYLRKTGQAPSIATTKFNAYRKTVIGNDVWIGYGALIRGGLEIGDGAIIAGGSVVVKDVEPFEVVGGNPTRHIRYRFKPEIIKRLLGLEWWKYDLFQVQTLPYSDLEASIDILEKRREAGDLPVMSPVRVTAGELRTRGR